MLLHFDTLISKVLFLSSIISLGNIKLKNHLQSLMTLMLDDLNSFIKKRVTAKSSDLTSCLATEKHSVNMCVCFLLHFVYNIVSIKLHCVSKIIPPNH